MTHAQPPREPQPRVEVLPPDEALRRARPLASPDEIEIEDVSDEQWDAFYAAISRT